MSVLAKKRKVLVVDDSETILGLFRAVINYEPDYEVMTAKSGQEALNMMDSFRPNVVLLDVMMPGMDGIEVCKTIRSNPKHNDTWISFVSAKGELKDRLKGYRVGGDDYIVKPFESSEILAKLRAYSHRKSESDKLISKKRTEKKSASFFSNPLFTTMMYELANFETRLIYIKTESPYCKFICEDRNDNYCRIRVSMKEIRNYFKEHKLLQVHRCYLVNTEMIISLQQKSTHDYDLVLKSNKGGIERIPVGRSYIQTLKEMDLALT